MSIFVCVVYFDLRLLLRKISFPLLGPGFVSENMEGGGVGRKYKRDGKNKEEEK